MRLRQALIEQQRETGAGLSLAAMCRVLEVSRAAYYRARQPPAGDNETALRDAIQRIAGGALLSAGKCSWRVLYESSPQAKNDSM